MKNRKITSATLVLIFILYFLIPLITGKGKIVSASVPVMNIHNIINIIIYICYCSVIILIIQGKNNKTTTLLTLVFLIINCINMWNYGVFVDETNSSLTYHIGFLGWVNFLLFFTSVFLILIEIYYDKIKAYISEETGG